MPMRPAGRSMPMQRMKRPVVERQQIVAQADRQDIEKDRQQCAGHRRDQHPVRRDRSGFLRCDRQSGRDHFAASRFSVVVTSNRL